MKLKKLLKANLTPIRKVIIKQGIHAIAFDYVEEKHLLNDFSDYKVDHFEIRFGSEYFSLTVWAKR